MQTYIILSRFSPEAFEEPQEFVKLTVGVAQKIKNECPGVKWVESFATLGRYDVLDIVEADDPQEVQKATMIIRGFGHSTTETMIGTPWKSFLKTL